MEGWRGYCEVIGWLGDAGGFDEGGCCMNKRSSAESGQGEQTGGERAYWRTQPASAAFVKINPPVGPVRLLRTQAALSGRLRAGWWRQATSDVTWSDFHKMKWRMWFFFKNFKTFNNSRDQNWQKEQKNWGFTAQRKCISQTGRGTILPGHVFICFCFSWMWFGWLFLRPAQMLLLKMAQIGLKNEKYFTL